MMWIIIYIYGENKNVKTIHGYTSLI